VSVVVAVGVVRRLRWRGRVRAVGHRGGGLGVEEIDCRIF